MPFAGIENINNWEDNGVFSDLPKPIVLNQNTNQMNLNIEEEELTDEIAENEAYRVNKTTKGYIELTRYTLVEGETEEDCYRTSEARIHDWVYYSADECLEKFEELWADSWLWEEVLLSDCGLKEVVINRKHNEIVLSQATEIFYTDEENTVHSTKDWKSKYFPLYPISAEDIIAQFDEFWELDPVMTLESDYVVSDAVEEDYQIAGQVLAEGIDLGEGYFEICNRMRANVANDDFDFVYYGDGVYEIDFKSTNNRQQLYFVRKYNEIIFKDGDRISMYLEILENSENVTVDIGTYIPFNGIGGDTESKHIQNGATTHEVQAREGGVNSMGWLFGVRFHNVRFIGCKLKIKLKVFKNGIKPFIKENRPDSKLALPQLSSLGELESLDTEAGVAQHTNGTVIFKDPKFDSNMPDKSIQAMLLPNKDNRLEFKTDPRNPVKLKTYMDKALDDCIVEENDDFIFYNDNPTGEAVFKAQYDKKNRKIITANSRIEFDKLGGIVVKNPVLRDPANEPDKDIVFGLQATNITGKWRLCSVAKDPTALPVGYNLIKHQDETDGSSVFYDVGRTSTANNIAGKITSDGEIYIGENYGNLVLEGGNGLVRTVESGGVRVIRDGAKYSLDGVTTGNYWLNFNGYGYGKSYSAGETVRLCHSFTIEFSENLKNKMISKAHSGGDSFSKDVTTLTESSEWVGNILTWDINNLGITFEVPTNYAGARGFPNMLLSGPSGGVVFDPVNDWLIVRRAQTTLTSTPKPFTDSSVPNGALKIAKGWTSEKSYVFKSLKPSSAFSSTYPVLISRADGANGTHFSLIDVTNKTNGIRNHIFSRGFSTFVAGNKNAESWGVLNFCYNSGKIDENTRTGTFKQILIYKGDLGQAKMENELSKDIRLEGYKFSPDIPNPKFICGIQGNIDSQGYNKLYAKSVNGQLPSGYENIEYWEEENGVYADMPAPTEGGI